MASVLTVNAGSSSLKFALFHGTPQAPVLDVRGEFERVGSHPSVRVADHTGRVLATATLAEEDGHVACVHWLIHWLEDRDTRPDVVAHRVVHGGTRYTAPTRITPEVRGGLDEYLRLAPLHQPHNLEAIDAFSAARPGLAQVACFDTGFHAGHAKEVRMLPVNQHLWDEGVRAYGFHGLSYEFVSGLPEVAAFRRVVVLHLGSGASGCALLDGRSVATTMGFTALDGLMMGTRCGSLDAGVVLHLLKSGLDADAVQELLYKHSGLLGVSGLSNDCRDLEAEAAKGHEGARLALTMFTDSIAGHTARLAVRLGGLDALVFTAGIGEHSQFIRAEVCQRLAFLGVTLDPAANAANARRISAPASQVAVLVTPTDEEGVMARAALGLDGIH